MFYTGIDPENTVLDNDESWRISRARLARMLQRTPAEVDALPYLDILDLLEVWRMDDEIARLNAKSPKG